MAESTDPVPNNSDTNNNQIDRPSANHKLALSDEGNMASSKVEVEIKLLKLQIRELNGKLSRLLVEERGRESKSRKEYVNSHTWWNSKFKEERMREGRCFYCLKQGHVMRDCPLFTKNMSPTCTKFEFGI